MGWFRTSKKDKERKEAMKTLKHFDKKKANKISSNADPSKAITELQPCRSYPNVLLILRRLGEAGELFSTTAGTSKS